MCLREVPLAPAWLWHRARQSGARRLHLAELRGRLRHRDFPSLVEVRWGTRCSPPGSALGLTCRGSLSHRMAPVLGMCKVHQKQEDLLWLQSEAGTKLQTHTRRQSPFHLRAQPQQTRLTPAVGLAGHGDSAWMTLECSARREARGLRASGCHLCRVWVWKDSLLADEQFQSLLS